MTVRSKTAFSRGRATVAAGEKAAAPQSVTQPDPTGYDPLQFRIRAKDEQGHYEKIQTQVPPELKTEIQSLVGSGMFEFDGEGGFVRWAIVNGVEFLRGYRPEYPSQISIIRSISLENARSEVRRTFRKNIEETAREAFELAGLGYGTEAAKHVHRVLSEIRKLDPKDPWRQIYTDEIRQKFGYLLKAGGPAASLVPELEDVDVDALTDLGVM